MTYFEQLNSTVLAEFAPVPFVYTPLGGMAQDIVGVVETGKDNPSTFSLSARRFDFAAEPRKGDHVAIPADINGIPAGNYVVQAIDAEDATGWMRIYFRYERPS